MKAKAIIPTAAELDAARRRGEEEDRIRPRAQHAHYDARNKRIVIELRKGAVVAIPLTHLPELDGATPRQLGEARASRFGDAIEFEDFDMHISVTGLLRDVVGLTGAASMIGSEGGKATSPAKASAARANGKRGGRPRKKSAA